MKRFCNVQWTKDFEVNIEKIDNDHKSLLSIFNALVDIANKKSKSNEFVQHLSSLTNYSLEHFKREEILMKEINFPNMEEHVLQHKSFIYKIAMFNLEFDKNNNKTVFELLAYLEEWLVEHIKTSDRKLINLTKSGSINSN